MKYMFRNVAVVFVTLLCSLIVMSSGLAFAAGNPSYAGVQCNGAAAKSPVCHAPTSDPLTGSNGVIVKATNILAIIAGFAAVLILIISGIHFITSNGDANAASSARSSIVYALVGLVVIVLARAIIMFVVSRIK